MPAKTTRREPDAQADLIGHSMAHADAFGCADKAVALRQAGKVKAAQAAERTDYERDVAGARRHGL